MHNHNEGYYCAGHCMYAETNEILILIVKTGGREEWQKKSEKERRQNSLAMIERKGDKGFRSHWKQYRGSL